MSAIYLSILSVLEALEETGHATFIKGEDGCSQIYEINDLWISFGESGINCIGENKKNADGSFPVLWTSDVKGGAEC